MTAGDGNGGHGSLTPCPLRGLSPSPGVGPADLLGMRGNGEGKDSGELRAKAGGGGWGIEARCFAALSMTDRAIGGAVQLER